MRQKHQQNDYDRVCALCEYLCYVEYDHRYICKYRNRCLTVEDTGSCRHFKFDLLKLSPAPKLPYKAEDIEILSVPPAEK